MHHTGELYPDHFDIRISNNQIRISTSDANPSLYPHSFIAFCVSLTPKHGRKQHRHHTKNTHPQGVQHRQPELGGEPVAHQWPERGSQVVAGEVGAEKGRAPRPGWGKISNDGVDGHAE